MNPGIILIAPTRQEYAVVRAAVRDLSSAGAVEVVSCGMGPASATAFCGTFDARAHTLRGLALVGWAGGISPALAAGDIAVADEALGSRGQSAPCTIIRLPGAAVGPMLTVSEPVVGPEAKAELWDGRLLAVEMEAYPLAAWAREHSLPFVHARVILDPADEALPDLSDVLDSRGQPRWGQLARRLARRPSLVVDLLRLARRAGAVNPVLGELVRSVVQGF